MCNITNEIYEMQRGVASLKKVISNYGEHIGVLESVWDSIPALMFYKDAQNNLIKVNRFFCTILKGNKEDFEGRSINELMKDQVQAGKYAMNDLIVIKSGKAKINIIEKLFDSEITVRTDKFPVQVDDKVVGVLGFSVILENNG